MKKLASVAVLGAASLTLAACGSSDDASSDLEADTVEMPADEALEPVAEEPVEDPEAGLEEVAAPAPVSEQTANEAADAAANIAAEAAAAAEAADAADAAANINLDVEGE